MLPVTGRQTSWVHYTTRYNTQSSALEDAQNNCTKYVELIGIINKPLLLHLVGCLYCLYQWCTVKEISNLQLENYKCYARSTGNSNKHNNPESLNLQTKFCSGPSRCFCVNISNPRHIQQVYWFQLSNRFSRILLQDDFIPQIDPRKSKGDELRCSRRGFSSFATDRCLQETGTKGKTQHRFLYCYTLL